MPVNKKRWMFLNMLKVHSTNPERPTSRFIHIIPTEESSKINASFQKLKEFCHTYITKHDKCYLKVYSQKKKKVAKLCF